LIPAAKNRAGDGSFASSADTTLPDIDIKDPTRGIAPAGRFTILIARCFRRRGV
jgi:hypothetical protein